jgi:hypothetical protein
VIGTTLGNVFTLITGGGINVPLGALPMAVAVAVEMTGLLLELPPPPHADNNNVAVNSSPTPNNLLKLCNVNPVYFAFGQFE